MKTIPVKDITKWKAAWDPSEIFPDYDTRIEVTLNKVTTYAFDKLNAVSNSYITHLEKTHPTDDRIHRIKDRVDRTKLDFQTMFANDQSNLYRILFRGGITSTPEKDNEIRYFCKQRLDIQNEIAGIAVQEVHHIAKTELTVTLKATFVIPEFVPVKIGLSQVGGTEQFITAAFATVRTSAQAQFKSAYDRILAEIGKTFQDNDLGMAQSLLNGAQNFHMSKIEDLQSYLTKLGEHGLRSIPKEHFVKYESAANSYITAVYTTYSAVAFSLLKH